jgi:hypothetical protein
MPLLQPLLLLLPSRHLLTAPLTSAVHLAQQLARLCGLLFVLLAG